jgi:hypothetical protein
LKPIAILGAALLAAASIQPSNAQWVQNSLTTPQAPNCPPGYSWTKSGPRYQCMTPPPSCQYGFASGPVWTGSAWAFSCNSPPPPPPAPPPPTQSPPPTPNPTPQQMCATAAAGQGITLGPNDQTFTRSGYTQRYYDNSIGPVWTDWNGNQGNSWQVTCLINESTSTWAPKNMNPFIVSPNYPTCAGCGGGT